MCGQPLVGCSVVPPNGSAGQLAHCVPLQNLIPSVSIHIMDSPAATASARRMAAPLASAVSISSPQRGHPRRARAPSARARAGKARARAE